MHDLTRVKDDDDDNDGKIDSVDPLPEGPGTDFEKNCLLAGGSWDEDVRSLSISHPYSGGNFLGF
jgi:hypothetical protein